MGNSSSSSPPSSSPSDTSSKKKKQTRNEKLVEKNWCQAIRDHKIELVVRFAALDCVCHYKGADQTMPIMVMLEACAAAFASFPDHKVEWDSIQEVEPGLVVITNFYGHGTNTGKPFGFGPYPPIAKTNKYVKETPFTMKIALNKRGQMTVLQFDTKEGELYGPPGYYVQLGGKLH